MVGLLFVSVLCHEFGHCFGARHVNGDASDVLLWPLGGLAQVDIPNTARAHFITAAAGPLVNIGLCVLAAGILPFLHDQSLQPPWYPFGYPGRDAFDNIALHPWVGGAPVVVSTYSAAAWAARLFWVNYVLALLNIVVIGFPLDGGRMFQSVMWSYVGYRSTRLPPSSSGSSLYWWSACGGSWRRTCWRAAWRCSSTSTASSSTSSWKPAGTNRYSATISHRATPAWSATSRRSRQRRRSRARVGGSVWQASRSAKRQQREAETREADERRMDGLLEKISSQGMGSLTDEERRFLKQFSDRYKNRRS